MSEWVIAVTKKKPVEKVAGPIGHNQAQTEDQVKKFLSTYKTKACNKKDFHDHRFCPFNHTSSDTRRNPYETYYPYHDSRNLTERMYHPTNFRTAVCDRDQCPFGKFCSHARSDSELRDRQDAAIAYKDHFKGHINTKPIIQSTNPDKLDESSLSVPAEISPTPVPTPETQLPTVLATELSPSVPDPTMVVERKRNFAQDCHNLWREGRIETRSIWWDLTDMDSFLLQHSKTVFAEMEQIAFEQGLGLLVKKEDDDLIHVTAPDPEQTQALAAGVLASTPLDDFVDQTQSFGDRIIQRVQAMLDKNPKALTESPDVRIHISGNTIRVLSANTKKKGKKLVQQVFDKIAFWVQGENYDSFLTCDSCLGSYNADQGICCSDGHFYCTRHNGDDTSCFDKLVATQIEALRSDEQGIVCPSCRKPYAENDVAAHMSEDGWKKYQKTIGDVRVAREREQLEREFEERLKAQLEEHKAAMSDTNQELDQQAGSLASEARNRVLNLSCPHCDMAYYDFDACMAIQCAGCKKSFCGYCHEGLVPSDGTHEHVRNCRMNRHNKGSYYANPDEIVDAQKFYRTRQLKKFLRRHNKDLQDRIMNELLDDLFDLNIDEADVMP